MDLNDEYYNKRLTDRRKGILQPKKAMKPKKSTLYCNNCNIPDNLTCCTMCNCNLCSTCMYNNVLCIKCNKHSKKSKKIHPEELRDGEYIKFDIFKKYICCFLNCNKK